MLNRSDPAPGALATTRADGRRLRGQESRNAILDAAADLIRDLGPDSLTHRAVATLAEVPVARVSYHFPTVDDLLRAAAGRFLGRFNDRLVGLAANATQGSTEIIEACTTFLYELSTTWKSEFIAAVQTRIELSRRGVDTTEPAIVEFISTFGVDRAVAEAVFAAMFGFATLAATEVRSVERTEIQSFVRTILGAVQ